ncbi:MAG: response regulator [Treponema sp.]|nr:response regulator [Treponema sp.]
MFFISLYILSGFLNLISPQPYPYVMIIAYRVVFPILIIDYKWRSNLINNVVMAVAVFYFSYRIKPTEIFMMDILTSSIFTCLGMLIGGQNLESHVRYFEIQDQQIDQALEVEKAKNEAKTNFVANMSHEIRTPVNSILGLNELILRETNERKTKEYAENIRASGDILLKIISDIIDFSKIEANKMEIISAEYELSSVITDLVNMVSQKAEEKHLELLVDIDENMPHLLFGDEIRVKQCILNILNNAVKYTERGTVTLKITFERLDAGQIYLIVSVKDTGIGIKPDEQERLFNKFERLDEQRNRTIEGSGLGLSIVSMLLQKMDSKLEFQSEYGMGSTFSFKLKQQVIWWEKIGNFNERYNKLLHTTKTYHESFRAPNAQILVVDDTRMNLIVFEGLLKKTEVKIDTASSGKEMLEKIRKKHYDVIFLDHRMPEMSGVEAFHAMQDMTDCLCKDVPVVALTANVVSGAKEYYLKEGFTAYLSKPIDSKELEHLLTELLPPEKTTSNFADDNNEQAAESPEDQFSNLKGISLHTAMQNCGSPDVFMVAVREYYTNIKKRADDIERFARTKDFKNYTIQVHALKSSSRLIGALELSEQAAYLEKCGDEQNEAEINAKTADMLTLYRSYIDKLSALEDQEDNDSGKEPLPMERYMEALAAIKEFAGSFDFNAIDSIIESIDGYKIPPEEVNRYTEIKRLSRGGDSAALLELLK